MAGGEDGKLFSIKGGNYQVPDILLKKSGANVSFNTQIKSIMKQDQPDGRSLFYLHCSSPSLNGEVCKITPYDAVIVAVPLDVPKCYIECDSCEEWPQKKDLGKYQQTVATFVQGSVKSEFFKLPSQADTPDAIFTTEDSDLFFSTIGAQRNIQGELTEPVIYKVFSRKPIDKGEIATIFNLEKSGSAKAVSWLAYPKYHVPEEFVPFAIDDGLFYVNAIERSASAMEMSAIGGRNAALLTSQYIHQFMWGLKPEAPCVF